METDVKFVFQAIGTQWEIDVKIPNSRKGVLLLKIKNRIEEFDKNYSRFRQDSLVSKISRTSGSYFMPLDFSPLFEAYKTLYKKTQGLFTPLIGNVLKDAGYDENYSLQRKTELSRPLPLDKILTFNNGELIVIQPVMLDFGAAGKGYVIDIIGKLLEDFGAEEFCIDAGGDILKKGSALKIGLENPLDTAQVIGSIEIQNNSICGSAGNRRKWNEFHHIINPHTLKSPTDILAVWVIANTALIADAVSTALFLDPRVEVANTYPCEYLIMFRDNTIQKSKHFNAELYYSE